MIQGLSKVLYGVLDGSGKYLPIFGGQGSVGIVSLGLTQARIPLAADCTLRNLTVLLIGAHGAVTLTVYKNGSATGLVVIGTASDTILTDTGQLNCAQGDDVAILADGDATGTLDVALFLDVETTGDVSLYGLDSQAASISQNSGYFGGAFNTGFASSYTAATESFTRSITAVAGTITTLVAKAFDGAPGSGVWTSYLSVNGTLQDGTGGSVNTACVITGTNTSATKTFSLAVSLLDHVDIVTIRTVSSAAFAITHVNCGIAFESGTAGYYMLCGGNNNVIPVGATSWRWLDNEQSNTEEARANAIIGPTSITAHALYTEFSDAPSVGSAYTMTLRKTAVDTALTCTIADTATSAQLVAEAVFVQGDLADIQIVPTAAPDAARFYWGMPVSETTSPPPPPETTDTLVMRCERIFQLPSSPTLKKMFLKRLEFVIQTAVGLRTGQGSDPQMMVSLSKDGGRSWGPEFWLSMGKMGEFRRAYKNGTWCYRHGAVKVAISDPVFVALVGAEADLEEGIS